MNKHLISLISILLCSEALADYPREKQMWFQEAATPVMEELLKFNLTVHYVIAAIVVLVCVLLLYTCIRFSAKNNPVPSKRSHNVVLEIFWTLVPAIIVLSLAIPSIKVLKFADEFPNPDMNIKVVAHQWYWEYIYPDHGEFSFMSYMIPDDQLKPGQIRLLDVDNRVVVPVGANVRVLVTSGDVIHSWAVPSFGIKIDAVPGRTNETWFHVNKPGVYYGQCSELCGINHGFMPIVIEAKSPEDFKKWIEEAKTKFSAIELNSSKLAAINSNLAIN